MLYPTCPLWGLDEDQLSDSKLYKLPTYFLQARHGAIGTNVSKSFSTF